MRKWKIFNQIKNELKKINSKLDNRIEPQLGQTKQFGENDIRRLEVTQSGKKRWVDADKIFTINIVKEETENYEPKKQDIKRELDFYSMDEEETIEAINNTPKEKLIEWFRKDIENYIDVSIENAGTDYQDEESSVIDYEDILDAYIDAIYYDTKLLKIDEDEINYDIRELIQEAFDQIDFEEYLPENDEKPYERWEETYDQNGKIFYKKVVDVDWFDENCEYLGYFQTGDYPFITSNVNYSYGYIYYNKDTDKFYKVTNAYMPTTGWNAMTRQWIVEEYDYIDDIDVDFIEENDKD